MLLAGEAARLALALVYLLEEIIYKWKQGRDEAMDISFYFLLQVVIMFRKQRNEGKRKKSATSPTHQQKRVRI